MATGSGRIMTVVLGGGRGSRLYPLTAVRAKPAVPLAGKYRLIDIPISNAINSGLREIAVLTQFNSASLNTHLQRTYRFDPFTNGFVEILAAEQTDTSGDWYQGTADAVRKHLHRLCREGVEHVLILSGDHLYRMRYDELIEHHEEVGADITVANIAVPRSECSAFGVLAADQDGWIRKFREKPADHEDIDDLRVPANLRDQWEMAEGSEFLASMGVYVFKAQVLRDLLTRGDHVDFGHHVLPAAIHTHKVAAYLFKGYWEDIGTIEAFYRANLNLCDEEPAFRFYVPETPIYTRPRFLPPTIHTDSHIARSIVSDGCVLLGANVYHSVIGLRSWILAGARIEESVVMGADYYETDQVRRVLEAKGQIPVGIGRGASLKRAIVDKNARIGDGAVIHGHPDRPDADHGDWVVRDGIIIIKKNTVIPAGAVL